MLVDACLRGDRRAFDQLVDRYEGPLYNAAYRITGSVEDAMDATQNAFVNAYEKLHTFDPTYRFFSWIYRIAINQALTLISKRRAENDIEVHTPVSRSNPEAEFSEAESNAYLRQALMALGPDDRTVIVLKHLEELSYREIGEMLEIPEKTVKSRLFTARKRLRKILVEQGFSL